MEKKIVRVRLTIKDYHTGVTLSQMTTYGVQTNNRTILVEDRYFKAGRKAGFGKSAYIHERENGRVRKVIIDKIEEAV